MALNLFSRLKTYLNPAELHRQGYLTQYYKFIARNKILNCSPVQFPEKAEYEVHIQVCRRDYINALWSIRSLVSVAPAPFTLYVHADASMGQTEMNQMRMLLPGAQFVDPEKVAAKVNAELKSVAPVVYQLWQSGKYFTLPKLVDTWAISEKNSFIMIEPDVLFFSSPEELFSIHPAVFCAVNTLKHNNSTDGMYCLPVAELADKFSLTLPARFGTGLGWFNFDRFDWSLLNDILAAIPVSEEQLFMLDQTIIAIWAVKHGFESLPVDRYTIEPVDSLNGVVTRHYYGKTRHLLYREGIPALNAKKLLKRSIAFQQLLD